MKKYKTSLIVWMLVLFICFIFFNLLGDKTSALAAIIMFHINSVGLLIVNAVEYAKEYY